MTDRWAVRKGPGSKSPRGGGSVDFAHLQDEFTRLPPIETEDLHLPAATTSRPPASTDEWLRSAFPGPSQILESSCPIPTAEGIADEPGVTSLILGSLTWSLVQVAGWGHDDV